MLNRLLEPFRNETNNVIATGHRSPGNNKKWDIITILYIYTRKSMSQFERDLSEYWLRFGTKCWLEEGKRDDHKS